MPPDAGPEARPTLFGELVRRRVLRTLGVYVVALFGLSQGAAELMPLFGAPEGAVRAVVIVGVALVPVVALLAWRFDLGPGGVVRDPVDEHRRARDDAFSITDVPTQVRGPVAQEGVHVTWQDGSAAGDRGVVFVRDFFVGRGSECGLRLRDPMVSRRHAQVYQEDEVWKIRDLGSTNGTFLGEERVTTRALPELGVLRVQNGGPPITLSLVSTDACPGVPVVGHGETWGALIDPEPRTPPGRVRPGPTRSGDA